jgi:spore germination protein
MIYALLISSAMALPVSMSGGDTTHFLHSQSHPVAEIRSEPSPSPATPSVTVYGYIPSWISNPLSVDFDSLTHAAWFSVGLDGAGNVTGAGSWNSIAADLVETAHAAGTKVHLTLTVFDEATQSSVLANPEARARAVEQLGNQVNDYGADGLNIDIEGMPASLKVELVAFTAELKEVVDEVYLATPAVDWNGAYDYDQLSSISDGLFIMAYDYHWSGGDPGPVGPLTGGGPWSDYAIDWTLNDYRTWGAADDKIVVGVPLYGFEWPSSSDALPGDSLGSGDAYSMVSAVEAAAAYEPRYDTTTDTPWVWTGSSQLWYDDPDSIEIKLSWAVGEGVQGVGFWAIGYDGGDPAFWSMVDSVTGADLDEPTGDTGGDPDTGGEPDTGPADAEYRDRDHTHSAEDEPKGGCGCSGHPGPAGPWALIPLLALVGRRRA